MPPLPLPPFYAPSQAHAWSYRPDDAALFAAARAWRRAHALQAAASDARRVHLLLIDVQRDFCFPEGSLYVGGRSGTGALDDSQRTVEFIYRNLDRVSEITCTLDSHLPFQVFSSSFWQDSQGEPLAPHREIRTEDVRAGRVQPNPDVAAFVCGGDVDWLRRQVEFYCAELERQGRYTLYLWPPHCLLGGEGHLLVGAVQAARLFHAWARSAPNDLEIKGRHALTENYSVLAPEVLDTHDGGRLAERNDALVTRLLSADALVIAGQAASHCVKSTLDDLLAEIQAHDPRLARKLYLLTDAMSAVAVPDPQQPGVFLADFTPQAEAALARLADAGANLVTTSMPMETWPGL